MNPACLESAGNGPVVLSGTKPRRVRPVLQRIVYPPDAQGFADFETCEPRIQAADTKDNNPWFGS